MAQRICCSTLQQIALSVKVRVIDFRTPCFFYRSRGEEFSFGEMVPKEICPDLFFHIYPQYLSVLYGGQLCNIKKELREAVVHCPGTEGKTVWRIRGEKLLLSPIINLASKFLKLVGKPKDLFDKKIIIELLETEGVCPRGYMGKVAFSFNQYSHLWGGRFFCPAVFYTIYPFLIAESVQVGNEESLLPIHIQCPADSASIVFEVIKGD